MPFLPYMSVYQNRFLSYFNWPSDKPVSVIKLAAAGFYYTGFLTTVKCFICGLWIHEWEEGDVPLEVHQAYSPRCEFLRNPVRNGTFNNVLFSMDSPTSSFSRVNNLTPPITTTDHQTPQPHPPHSNTDHPAFVEYADQVSRMGSFHAWPYNDKQNRNFLVEAGFFYTGETDHAKCFCCGIGLKDWGFHDDPWTVHAYYSPDCRYLKNKMGQEFIGRVQSTRRKPYRPKSPFYENYTNRLQTYTNWNTECKQTPTELEEAGFYYSGYGDGVRCFYCDGGLQQWEPGDNPWTEHARWFPHCAYVLRMTGSIFIDTVQRRFNNYGDTGSTITATNMPISNGHQTNTASGTTHTTRIQPRSHASTCICKVCLIKSSTVTLLPCGHLVTCVECAKDILSCPSCGRRVVQHLQT